MTLNFTEMQDSLYNTPPCWSIYVCGLVFKHLLAAGGLEAVKANNDAKVLPPLLQTSPALSCCPVRLRATLRSSPMPHWQRGLLGILQAPLAQYRDTG